MNQPELLRKPPFRCEDCPEKNLLISVQDNKNWYICGRSPIPGIVNAWKCCNDVTFCPLGKRNLHIIK